MRTRSIVRRHSSVAVAVLAAALMLSACGDDEGDGDTAEPEDVQPTEFPEGSTMARLAEEGSITIGTKFDQPLFGLQGPSGEPEGFDVEIGKIIASELGISDDDIEWVETISANREPFIQDGQVDIVVATYTINDERKQVVDFAGPYYVAGQSLLVLADNEDIQSVDDLAGKRVCSAEGSTPLQNIRDNYPDAQTVPVGQYSDCLDPLRNGQVDVLTTDNVILSGFIDQNPDEFELRGEPFTEEPYGIGLKKGDDDFRDFINDVLEESYEDGRWEEAWENTAGEVLDTPEPPEVDRY